MTTPTRNRSGPSTGRVALLALGLVTLLALASAGTSVMGASGGEGADRYAVLSLAGLLFGLGLPAGLLVALALRRIPRARPSPPIRVTLLRALPATVFAVVVLSLLLVSRAELRQAVPLGPIRGEESGRIGTAMEIVGWFDGSRVRANEGEPELEPRDPDAPDSDRRRALMLVAAALGAVVAGVFVWRALRSRRTTDDDSAAGTDRRREAAHGAVVGTIDTMLSDPDPRTAIIGAYARLLEGLAASGTPRRHYEGPMEHLQRALEVLRVRPEPSRRLIELFGTARFSSHRLGPAHREAALDALRAVAADLADTPTVDVVS